jgi:hypothetical protein
MDGLILKFVDNEEVQELMEELHIGLSGGNHAT